MAKVWINRNDKRVILIEDSECFYSFLDLTESGGSIHRVMWIPKTLGSKSLILEPFQLADIAVQDFYLTVLK